MKNPIFTGSAVAIVTPFTETGVDYDKLAELIEYHIDNETDCIVICGTTGESSTMPDEEHMEAIRFTVEKAAGRIPVVAGTGSNDTAHAIVLSQYAEKVGADGLLVVTPYYNKTTQHGLYLHTKAIAESVNIPIILYNIPGRTGGLAFSLDVLKKLAALPNINGIKEASGDIAFVAQIAAETDLNIYAGNDDMIVPCLSLGGKGVISVLSNLLPAETALMCRKFLDGDVKGAAAMQMKYHALIDALFCEVNPIPVKAAMAKMGWCENYLRLPLTPMEESNAEKLFALMREQNLIK